MATEKKKQCPNPKCKSFEVYTTTIATTMSTMDYHCKICGIKFKVRTPRKKRMAALDLARFFQ